MNNSVNERSSQFNNILYAIKLLAILFSSIPIYQFIFKGSDATLMVMDDSLYTNARSLIVMVVILMLVLLVSSNAKKPSRFRKIAEIVMFFVLFYAAVYVSGFNESYYKFIFIFLIVSASIEYEITVGLIVAIISSASILVTDAIAKIQGTNLFLENDLALTAMFLALAFILGLYSKMQREHITFLQNDANTDGLTQIYNHRYFYQSLEEKCVLAERQKAPLSLIMLDIDYFKIYNDIYGHQAGDTVLRQLVSVLSENLTGVDNTLCRYGGEEFAIILPGARLDDALDISNKLRVGVEEFEFYGENALPDKNLTISLGVAQLRDSENFNDLVKRSDHALYRAKYLRRNRVESYSSIIEEYYTTSEDESIDLTPLKTLIMVINSKDSYTYNHTERVVNYCDIFAKHLNILPSERKPLIYAAFLHDLGKINIDKEILVTQERLTDEQWNILRAHPADGAALVRQVGVPENIARIIEQHHERVDGRGYPAGLANDEIDYLARVLTVVDSFDAMTNNRPYNRRKTFEEGYEELQRCAGSQFDPFLVDEFIKAMKKITPN